MAEKAGEAREAAGEAYDEAKVQGRRFANEAEREGRELGGKAKREAQEAVRRAFPSTYSFLVHVHRKTDAPLDSQADKAKKEAKKLEKEGREFAREYPIAATGIVGLGASPSSALPSKLPD